METALTHNGHASCDAQHKRKIKLRLIDRTHTETLFRLIQSNREHLRPWHPWADELRSADDVENRISAWQQQHASHRGFCAGIWFNDQLCGLIQHVNVDWTNRWTALSYWLDASHQGRGIMTTCCRALVAHGFLGWNLYRITIECATENVRSRAIPERLGFKFEGVVRGAEWIHDRYVDHAVYGLLRPDCQWLSAVSTIPCPDGATTPAEPARPDNPTEDPFTQSLKLAFEMHNAGRTAEAEALCRVLVRVRRKDAESLFLLGMILHKTGRDEEAAKWLSLAARHEPKSARIFDGLGCVYQSLKDPARAAGHFERAITLEPGTAGTHYNLGRSCYELDQIERAAALFQRAVELEPRDAGSWNNLGKCLKELNRLDESITAYNRAVEIAPEYKLPRYGRAIALLTAGRLKEGFREYEWRWDARNTRKIARPEWKGETAPDKTVLVHAEQGFGDAIQMIQFLPTVRERVGRVILECRPELETLFQYSKCADVVIPFGAPIPPFDCFVSLMSLPLVLGVTLDTIPNRTPYLRAPVGERLPDDPQGRLKVGLVWAGNPGHHRDAFRSIRLEKLTPILQVPGVAFYSLQQTVPAQDEAYLRLKSDIIHSGLALADFLDTASVIAQLDLVIAVDTSVAHLAGALGKPVWTLHQHAPDWRWFLNREDSPWYPTMRLYRQVKRNHWEEPVMRVAEALRRLSASTSAAARTAPKIEPEFSDAVPVAA